MAVVAVPAHIPMSTVTPALVAMPLQILVVVAPVQSMPIVVPLTVQVYLTLTTS